MADPEEELQGALASVQTSLKALEETLASVQISVRLLEQAVVGAKPANPLDEQFPADEQERQHFIKEWLEPRRNRPGEIADLRIKEKFGKYDRRDPDHSSWRAREANRFIEEYYRQRELRLVRYSIYAAIAVGIVAICVAVLAMPVRDSVAAWLLSPH